MSSDEIIKFSFVWGPTILFFSIIILSFIGGMIKGFRKSLILAINALVAFTICLIAFFVIVNNENVDANIVSAVIIECFIRISNINRYTNRISNKKYGC